MLEKRIVVRIHHKEVDAGNGPDLRDEAYKSAQLEATAADYRGVQLMSTITSSEHVAESDRWLYLTEYAFRAYGVIRPAFARNLSQNRGSNA